MLNHYDLWTGLLGGLALFLFGMDIMTRALKAAAGDRMKGILAALTRNRFVGALSGAVVTAVINSSSVTTVITVGFISAGLLSLSQAVGVIMGANIGSTMTAQILAFKVSALALPMIALGFATLFLAKREMLRHYGAMLLGLGLVFYGMSVMSDAMRPLRDYAPFLDAMVHLQHAALAVLVGAAFTAVIQSSAATTGIVIVMAGQGLIALPAAIAIALGANIGTCATAGLAAIGKPREAVRAALVHVLFNVAGVLMWIGFVPEMASLAAAVSPAAAGLTGMEKAAAEAPRQIANAHTLFNVINTLVFIGFAPQFARLAEWLVPDRPLAEVEVIRPRFLDDTLLDTPTLALERARLELARLGGLVHEMFTGLVPAVLTGTRAELRAVAAMDNDVDVLHGEILRFLGQVSVRGLSAGQVRNLMSLMEIANHLEQIGDSIENALVRSGMRRIDERVTVSERTREMIEKYHARIADALAKTVKAIEEDDPELSGKVRAMKADIRRAIQEAVQHEAARLVADAPNRLKTYTREVEVIEGLRHVFGICRRIARAQIRMHEHEAPEPEPPAEAPPDAPPPAAA